MLRYGKKSVTQLRLIGRRKTSRGAQTIYGWYVFARACICACVRARVCVGIAAGF